MEKLSIYTDGSCPVNRGNNDGGWAAVIISENGIHEIYGGESNTTNNRMELSAAIQALYYIPDRHEITIYSDSQYMVDGMNAGLAKWKKNNFHKIKNRDLWETLDILNTFHDVTWKWIRGHSGNKYNERADELALKGVHSLTKKQ